MGNAQQAIRRRNNEITYFIANLKRAAIPQSVMHPSILLQSSIGVRCSRLRNRCTQRIESSLTT